MINTRKGWTEEVLVSPPRKMNH